MPWPLQGSEPVRALGIRNTNAPAAKPPVGASKPAAGKRAAPAGAKLRTAGAASAGTSSGPADDDDAGLAAGTLSKAEAEEKLLELFGEGTKLVTMYLALHGCIQCVQVAPT